MTTGNDVQEMARSWWIPVVIGGLSLLAGVFLIAYPDISLTALAIVAGIDLLVIGAVAVGTTLADDDGTDQTLGLLLGILTAVAGLVVIRRPGDTVLVLVLAIGIWLVLDGLLDLARALFAPSGQRLSPVARGLVGITLGILILSLPHESVATVAILVGIGFVLRGLFTIGAGILLRGAGRQTPGAPAASKATARPLIRH
jgi:uncharacterized membrane protein HdeD (DUF308 family)